MPRGRHHGLGVLPSGFSITNPSGAGAARSWWDVAQSLHAQLNDFEAGKSFSADSAHCRPIFAIYKYAGLPCDQVQTLIKADIWAQAKNGLAALAAIGVPRVASSGYTLGQTRQRYYNAIRSLIEAMVRASNVCFVVSNDTIGQAVVDSGCNLPKIDGSGYTGGAQYQAAAPRMLVNCDVEFQGERQYDATDYYYSMDGAWKPPTQGRPFGYQGAAPFETSDALKGSVQSGHIDSFQTSINENTSVIGLRYWRQLKGPVDRTPSDGTIVSPFFNLRNTAITLGAPPAAVVVRGSGPSVSPRYVVLESEIGSVPAQDATPCGAKPTGAYSTYSGAVAPVAAGLSTTPLPDTWGLDGIAPITYYRYAACPQPPGMFTGTPRMAWFQGTTMSGEAICLYAQALASDWSSGVDLYKMYLDSLANYLAYIQNYQDAGLIGPDLSIQGMQAAVQTARSAGGYGDASAITGGATAVAAALAPAAATGIGILAGIGTALGLGVVMLIQSFISPQFNCPGPFQIRISDQPDCAQIDPNAPGGGAAAGAQLLKQVFTSHADGGGPPTSPKTSKTPWIIGGIAGAVLLTLVLVKVSKP